MVWSSHEHPLVVFVSPYASGMINILRSFVTELLKKQIFMFNAQTIKKSFLPVSTIFLQPRADLPSGIPCCLLVSMLSQSFRYRSGYTSSPFSLKSPKGSRHWACCLLSQTWQVIPGSRNILNNHCESQ